MSILSEAMFGCTMILRDKLVPNIELIKRDNIVLALSLEMIWLHTVILLVFSLLYLFSISNHSCMAMKIQKRKNGIFSIHSQPRFDVLKTVKYITDGNADRVKEQGDLR